MNATPTTVRLLAAATLLPALVACASYPGLAGDVRPLQPMVVQDVAMQATAEPTAGAIYREGPGMRLFTDRKAREVGDIVTITLVENTTATANATTAVTKESTTGTSGTVFGLPVTVGGQDVLNNNLNTSRDFAGNGNTAQSNNVSGSVTAQVVQRLANGNLVVQGSKRLRLNQGDELVQIQGIIRPADILPDNTVLSTRVANAEIVYGGRGTVARSNAMGWLDRFFNGAWFPN